MNHAFGLTAFALLVSFAADASAYCVYNGLRERSISVVQEDHPEKSREERKLNVTLKPGQSACCNFYNLDCNPAGREEGIVEEPAIKCGLPGGRHQENLVTATSTGSLRVLPNPRARNGAIPYVIRSRARDGKDLSGPAGIACRKPSKESP